MQKSVLDQVLEAIETSGKSIRQISRESGIHRNTIFSWFHKKSVPTVLNAEAVLNTIGYNITLNREGGVNERSIEKNSNYPL